MATRKPRRGRPPKPVADRRRRGITVWLTDEQHAAIVGAAERAGKPASVWLAELAVETAAR